MVIVIALYAGGWDSIRRGGGDRDVRKCLSKSASPYQGVKMGPANVERTGIRALALHGMFGGTTVPIHLKVMAYTKVG